MDYVREILKQIPARTALDVATGLGYMAKKISTYCPLIETIYAIDLNNKAIQSAAELNEEDEKIQFAVMDAEELRFPGNSMDLVTVQASMHHFREPKQCLSEMYRVLKPNAALLIEEELDEYDTPEQKVMHDWHKIGIKIDQRMGVPHYELFSEERLRNLLSEFAFFRLAIERQSDTEVIKDPDKIEEMLIVLYNYYEKIQEESDRFQLADEIEDVKNRLKRHGFAYPPTLIVMGMK
jgi:SAM-dependent methyltransferase